MSKIPPKKLAAEIARASILLIVDQHSEIASDRGRRLAARRLGLREVRVVRLDSRFLTLRLR